MAIFTVGYSGRKLDKLISLFGQYRIDLVADVRRFPKSANLDYNRENLERCLPDVGVDYVYMGDSLGGLRRGGYLRHMQTELYRRGISRLLDIASGRNIVLMCKERSESGCHRRYIVETLRTLNIEVASLESNRQGCLW